MINNMAYDQGAVDAMTKFAAGIPVTAFPKKLPVTAAIPAAGHVAPTAPMKAPVMGGAAAPSVAANPVGGAAAAAPAAKPGFMDSWKGQAAMQLGVPLAMAGVQNMMTPSAPKDPNAL